MIDIDWIRKHQKEVKKLLAFRLKPEIIDQALKLDAQWRMEVTKLQSLLAKRNELSKRAKDDQDVRNEVKKIKTEIEATQKKSNAVQDTLRPLLESIPNIPHVDTPKGSSSKDNIVLREMGKKRVFSFTPKTYLELDEKTGDIDLAQGVKASGARFSYIKGQLAKIEFALLTFAIKELQKEGFELVFPPTLLQRELIKGMGYLDQGGDQEIFQIEKDGLYLSGTAEHALGGLFMKKNFSHHDLPKQYMAFTPCYRREAGSYGKDTKGIFRLHQFEKLEMFAFTTQEQSEVQHLAMLSMQEKLMNALELPYRVVALCSGDLGLPSARTFDIETFLPGQNNGKGEYRETHSTSSCTDFQTRRLGITYQGKDGKKYFAHTVNGTAFAMQRMLIAILENYQQEDGSYAIPNVLKGYMN